MIGHPSFVMSASFTNQTLAQIELYANNKDGKYKKQVYVLPKTLDEKVARLHLAKIGVKLTELRKDQADYIGVPQARSRPIITGIDYSRLARFTLSPRGRGEVRAAHPSGPFNKYARTSPLPLTAMRPRSSKR